MLKIKLARFGKRHQPHFRIVVNEARDKRDGSYVALLGQYAPTQQPKILNIDVDAYKTWLAKGAQPTDTVAALVKRYESGNPFPVKKASLSKKAKAKAAAEAEAATQPKEEAAPAAEAEVTAEATEATSENVSNENTEVELSSTEAAEAPAETPAA
jgi:small subunit ribosomal protein S16